MNLLSDTTVDNNIDNNNDDILNVEDVKVNEEVVQTVSSKTLKTPIVKAKTCHVINYIESHGILGFDFDGIGCQISIEPFTKIDNWIDIKYTGEIGKDIRFFL